MPDAPFPNPPSDALTPTAAVRILLSTITPGKARAVAAALVEERLAACVNLVPGLRSLYRWKDALCDEPETLLVIKAHANQVEALARRLAELHPYEVPELLCLTPESALPAYLAWIETQGRATPES